MIKFWLLFVVVSFVYIAFEMYTAPQMDEYGRVTKPGKKLSDLWRKRR